MTLNIKAKIQIQHSVSDVYDNIVNPNKMTQYFIGSSTGKMAEGAELTWTFPEFEELCPVTVLEIIPEEKITFRWDPETLVEIRLIQLPDKSTLVTVSETGKEFSEANLKWFAGNTEGWANFLACLKAFSEYGINLRKGAFDFMKKNSL